ncbi:maleylpyruvate isomerase family mycothiol-dependent enzyme [Catellatospora sp. KI3]|uniref:maleylpyruvate isomerase family mycothiol-dependent enzyme n=1 Tax=Catellatospora sp. KI3 TaxID=3041620 RepID=UPI002483049C|nr:maleylpyruvate isomerase family mycothiol-dependent enzyme [Catellatospora sp. KI3]MDI1463125.1 maleylpyruvate isomerase family mycothiol-dependent enzyme [Catellatospora sp. KI3]
MHNTLQFTDLLRLIDERSAAFRAAIAAAPDLDAQVPTCPEWTLFDLAQHLGGGRRSWAATVAAGPAATGRVKVESAAPREREALLAWLAASTRQLLDALREAGPDRACWTWWDTSQSPQTCGAVARHQLQEVTVHTYDAQLTVGDSQPLPAEVALDGVEDFLFTCCATTSPWPHEPATVHYHATEGRSWRVLLSADGAQVTHLTEPYADKADVSATGTAGELVLFMYGRTPLDLMPFDGDRRVFEQLIAWEPE